MPKIKWIALNESAVSVYTWVIFIRFSCSVVVYLMYDDTYWVDMWDNSVILIQFYSRHWEHPVRVRRCEGHNPTIQPEGVQPRLSVHIKGPWHKSVIVCKTHNINIITSRHNVYVNSRTEIGCTNLFQLKMFNEKVRVDCKSFNPNTRVGWGNARGELPRGATAGRIDSDPGG